MSLGVKPFFCIFGDTAGPHLMHFHEMSLALLLKVLNYLWVYLDANNAVSIRKCLIKCKPGVVLLLGQPMNFSGYPRMYAGTCKQDVCIPVPMRHI